MSEVELCEDPFDDVAYCELPRGHEGNHHAELNWAQSEPRDPTPPTPSRYVPAAWAGALRESITKGLMG